MKKPSEFHARLTIHDFPMMTKKQKDNFIKWLRGLATEFNKCKDQKEYANPCRATLYK